MAKQVCFSGWISIIPDQMLKNWVKAGYIPNTKVLFFSELRPKEDSKAGEILYQMSNGKDYHDWEGKWVKKSEMPELEKKGWKITNIVIGVKNIDYNTMKTQVNNWYDEVLEYITLWLTEKGYIKLQKGSFKGGFCATDQEDETTKDWGAPLASPENKVVQIKEKFGQIRVYFTSLSDAEDKELNQFQKHLEKKFDCQCAAWG